MKKAIDAGKYVVCANQMIKQPKTTRAEVSDTNNAALDLTDATMTLG
jgi:pyruvate kinase